MSGLVLEEMKMLNLILLCSSRVPAELQGLSRFEARGRILAQLENAGSLVGSNPHAMVVPICSRSGDVIEPLLSTQWFIDCRDMAQVEIKVRCIVHSEAYHSHCTARFTCRRNQPAASAPFEPRHRLEALVGGHSAVVCVSPVVVGASHSCIPHNSPGWRMRL